MGEIKRVLQSQTVPTPLFNERLIIEACENVHLHYRNVRLEFSPSEFLILLKAFQGIDPRAVTGFAYGPGTYQTLGQARLPAETEFNSRLQIEEQANGTFHVHYRNLRLECESLTELGYPKTET